jgi:hypothetical protein
MKATEAAVFALVLGFTSGILMLAGLVVRSDHHDGSVANEVDPGATEHGDAPGESSPGEGGPQFDVRVRDATGAAIGGATVRLAARNERGARTLERHTDERGSSSFPALPQSEQELRVSKSGFATLKRVLSLAPGDAARPDHMDVVLRGADRSLEGRVVDQDGAPVAGLHVVARAQDAENLTTFNYDSVSSRDGSFQMRGVPDLAYELTVAPDQADQFKLAQAVTAQPDGGDIVLRLARRGSAAAADTRVTGCVRGAGGKPLAEVEVQLTSTSLGGPARGPRGVTDQKGAFSIAGVAPGSYRLTAGKVEYSTSSMTVEIRAGAEQALPPIDLRRGGEITATITDQSGRPLPSVPVRVIGSEPSFNLVYRTAQDGTIHATGLPEGKYLIKVAMASGASRELFLRDGERASVSLAQ